jgi:endonuclease/exonuclease/phosphatase family metal-dependent hydrolase
MAFDKHGFSIYLIRPNLTEYTNTQNDLPHGRKENAMTENTRGAFFGILIAGVAVSAAWYLTVSPGASTPDVPNPIGHPVAATESSADPVCATNRTTFRYLSWNLGNFGKSKSDETIEAMADIIFESGADLVAGQEVSMNYPGPQAVARLQESLSRRGFKWDSFHSDPTLPRNPSSERYGFWYKPSKFETNRREAHLVSDLRDSVEREPFTAEFLTRAGNSVRVFQYHAVPAKKNPSAELDALKLSNEFKMEKSAPAILSGDFNLSPKDTDPRLVPLGFRSNIQGLTSLKQSPKDGEHLFRQYDNIYTHGNIVVCFSSVIDFTSRYPAPISADDLRKARAISDHLPMVIGFQFGQ